MVNKEIGPLQDAQRAIQFVKKCEEMESEHKPDWHHQVSAGGHLASTLGTHSKPVIENKQSINLRPDFMILVYPVISFTTALYLDPGKI
jgi:hypothetical protein